MDWGELLLLSLLDQLQNGYVCFIKFPRLCKVNSYWQVGVLQINAGSSYKREGNKKTKKIPNAFISCLSGSCSNSHCCGMEEAGARCVFQHFTVLVFVSLYWNLLEMDMWASHVLQWIGGSQFELLPFALSSIMIFIFPWHLPRLSMPPA